MTPATALTAVVARLTAAGLSPIRSPLGAHNASSQRIEGGFAVKPNSVRPAAQRGRGRADVPGLRVDTVFTIELTHQIKPGLGPEAPSQALQDLHAAWVAISAPATTLTTEGAIAIGAASNSYEGGGAFYLTRFELVVTFNLDLS